MAYFIANLTILPLSRLWIRKVAGQDNLLKEKSFIFACNHGSFAEDLILPAVIVPKLRKLVHIYCNDRFFKYPCLGNFLRTSGCIPVSVDKHTEESKKINQKAFDDAISYLKKGEPVGIFPEGHRSRDGTLQKAKTGVARLALKAKVPVIPIGAVGTYDILPKGSSFPRFRKCEINIGKPMHFDEFFGQENNGKVLIHITDMIMKEIADLAGLRWSTR